MGVSFVSKSSGDSFEYLSLFGVTDGQIAALKKAGATVQYGTQQLKIIKDSEILATVSLQAGAITMAKEGKLGPVSLKHLKATMQAAAEGSLTELGLAQAGCEGHPPDMDVVAPAPKPAPAAPFPTFANVTKAPAEKNPTPTDLVFNVQKMSSEPTIKLLSATRLYEPVVGSSGGSRYFVIAVAEDLKIAARVKGMQVSIRAEGNLAKYKDQLAGSGLLFSGSATYTSLHMQCENATMIKRAIGAVVTGIEADFVTPLPVIKHLIGKGH